MKHCLRILIVLTLSVAATSQADDSQDELVRLFGKHDRDADGRLVLLERPNQELLKLERLERLSLTNTRVSQDAVRCAKQNRPTLRITGL
ncbi:MAG: hypothetical protein ACKV2Q_17095 [Planctomycetaceae bacterium]